MAWNAKPSGGYDISSQEARENMIEIYNMLNSTWTLEAICGMLGNFMNESGMNPWRWQSDRVDINASDKGYGLAQFTPASGYIYGYGSSIEGYSPNLSTTSVTSGATPQDGYAQIICINEDRAGKFINRASFCHYYDISGCYPMSAFRQITDLKKATIAWLFNYEFPAEKYRDEAHAELRYESAEKCYEILSGVSPLPPSSSGYLNTTPTKLSLKKGEVGKIVVKASNKYTYTYGEGIRVEQTSNGFSVENITDASISSFLQITLIDGKAVALVTISLNDGVTVDNYIKISPKQITINQGETAVFDIDASGDFVYSVGRGGVVTALTQDKIAVTSLASSNFKKIILNVMLKNARNIKDSAEITVLSDTSNIVPTKIESLPWIYWLKRLL